MSWPRSARRCGYFNNEEFLVHKELSIDVEKLLCYMLRNQNKFRGKFGKK